MLLLSVFSSSGWVDVLFRLELKEECMVGLFPGLPPIEELLKSRIQWSQEIVFFLMVLMYFKVSSVGAVSYTHLTLPTIYSV